MRVLAISGSLRASSSNTLLLTLAAGLAPEGVEVTLYRGLGDLPHFNPDLDRVLDDPALPEAVRYLRRRVAAADALLISSPEYAHGVPGSLKNALDWLVGGSEIPGKPVALVNTSPRATHAQASLAETLRTMSADLVAGSPFAALMAGKGDGEALAADPEVAVAVRAAFAALVRACRTPHAPATNVIETERLALRRLTEDDAEFMLGLLNEPSFLSNIGDRGVRTVEDARAYLLAGPIASYEKFGFGMYLATRREDGAPVGICGLVKRDALEDVDVGYALLPAFWSCGYALESAAAVVAHGKRDFGLKRIAGIVQPGNQASIRVLEKLGLAFERMVRLSEDGPESMLYAAEL